MSTQNGIAVIGSDRPDGDHAPASPEIHIDDEFAQLLFPPTQEEENQLEANLLADRICRDPLTVWAGTHILLDGHRRLAICKQHGISFTVTEIELPGRDAARDWIVRQQLGRRNLTVLQAAYLRGKQYLAQKQPHGGPRRAAEASAQNGHSMVLDKKTADKLSKEHGVSGTTVRRDADFAADVDRLAAECGPAVKHDILAGKRKLSRTRLTELARMRPEEMRRAVEEARTKPANPKTLKPKPAGGLILHLPTKPGALAQAIVDRLGPVEARRVYDALGLLLNRKPASEKEAVTMPTVADR